MLGLWMGEAKETCFLVEIKIFDYTITSLITKRPLGFKALKTIY
jgi:hypothetical protein